MIPIKNKPYGQGQPYGQGHRYKIYEPIVNRKHTSLSITLISLIINTNVAAVRAEILHNLKFQYEKNK